MQVLLNHASSTAGVIWLYGRFGLETEIIILLRPTDQM
jgi:hypothetical protein